MGSPWAQHSLFHNLPRAGALRAAGVGVGAGAVRGWRPYLRHHRGLVRGTGSAIPCVWVRVAVGLRGLQHPVRDREGPSLCSGGAYGAAMVLGGRAGAAYHPPEFCRRKAPRRLLTRAMLGRENFPQPSCAGLTRRCGGRTVLGRGLRTPPAGRALGAEPCTCYMQQVLCDSCCRALLPPDFRALTVSSLKQGQRLHPRCRDRARSVAGAGSPAVHKSLLAPSGAPCALGTASALNFPPPAGAERG